MQYSLTIGIQLMKRLALLLLLGLLACGPGAPVEVATMSNTSNPQPTYNKQELKVPPEAVPTTTTTLPPPPKPAALKKKPNPPPDLAPVASGGSGDAEAAVRAHFGDIFSQAWGVSGCESGHNPGAVSPGGGNWGLFQINTVHKSDFESYTGQPWSSVLDAGYNSMYARKLYNSSGWGPWSCAWAAG